MSDSHMEILKRKAEQAAILRQWPESEDYYRQLCTQLEAERGSDHLELAMALHQLAFVLAAQGKMQEAESLRERTSEILLQQHRKD